MFEIKVIEPIAVDDDEKDIDAELDLLRVAAKAIEKHERLKAELRQHEQHLSRVCQTYGQHYRIWGYRPEHLRQACVARGLLK
jgi:ABC-type Fe3+-citrate transport system substrate-binding protein